MDAEAHGIEETDDGSVFKESSPVLKEGLLSAEISAPVSAAAEFKQVATATLKPVASIIFDVKKLPLVLPGIIVSLILVVLLPATYIFAIRSGSGSLFLTSVVFVSTVQVINVYWCFCIFRLSSQFKTLVDRFTWWQKGVAILVAVISTNLVVCTGFGTVVAIFLFRALWSLIILACHAAGSNTTNWLYASSTAIDALAMGTTMLVLPSMLTVWYFKLFQRVQSPLVERNVRTKLHSRFYSLFFGIWFLVSEFVMVFVTPVVILLQRQLHSDFLKMIPAPAIIFLVFGLGLLGSFVALYLCLKPLRKLSDTNGPSTGDSLDSANDGTD